MADNRMFIERRPEGDYAVRKPDWSVRARCCRRRARRSTGRNSGAATFSSSASARRTGVIPTSGAGPDDFGPAPPGYSVSSSSEASSSSSSSAFPFIPGAMPRRTSSAWRSALRARRRARTSSRKSEGQNRRP